MAGTGAVTYVVIVIYENPEAVRQIPANIYTVVTSTGQAAQQEVKYTLRSGESYLIDYYSLETQDKVLAVTPDWVKHLYFDRFSPLWRN